MNFKHIKLYSANLSAQKNFYIQLLGLELIAEGTNYFTIQVGQTALSFEAQEGAKPYHYAFNIPSNQGENAVNWLKERVSILDVEGEDLVDFYYWNAEAMYFYDEDKNIVEFIARKNLNIQHAGPFDSTQILEISELGIPTHSVEGIYQSIQHYFPVELYSGNLERFAALGDEHGLFIVINKEQKKWMPRNDEAYPAPFELTLTHRDVEWQLSYKNGQLC